MQKGKQLKRITVTFLTCGQISNITTTTTKPLKIGVESSEEWFSTFFVLSKEAGI